MPSLNELNYDHVDNILIFLNPTKKKKKKLNNKPI